MLDTPILFIVFNRPETTIQAFDRIRYIKPKRLFISADGPRPGNPSDVLRCAQVKEIVSNIDWECEVQTLYHEKNLGCGIAPATAISWFFEEVESGIILEDDCIADPSFFSFCQEMLEYYKNDESIMHISGNNFSFTEGKPLQSYYFNFYFTAWGWATWRRAWKKYDYEVKFLDEFYSSEQFRKVAYKNAHRKYWKTVFDLVKGGERKDIWDYQWILTCWYNNGLAITPAVNLVKNIGFDEHATHTKGEYLVTHVKTGAIVDIIHPNVKERNIMLDQRIFKYYFDPPQHVNKLRDLMYGLFSKKTMYLLRSFKRRYFPNIK